MPYRMGGGGGSTVTAGGLVLRGEPDGNFVALDAKTGEVLWRFQTGFGADAPPVVYEVDGEQYIAIVDRRQSDPGQRYGDAVWTFSLNGKFGRCGRRRRRRTVAGPTRPDRRRRGHGQDRRQQRRVRLLRRPARGSRREPR